MSPKGRGPSHTSRKISIDWALFVRALYMARSRLLEERTKGAIGSALQLRASKRAAIIDHEAKCENFSPPATNLWPPFPKISLCPRSPSNSRRFFFPTNIPQNPFSI